MTEPPSSSAVRGGIPLPEERPWLTVRELSDITGEGVKTIRRALREGQLPLLEVGRFQRIPTAELRRQLGLDADTSEHAKAAPASAASADVLALARKLGGPQDAA